ncbi:MAG: alpha/beta fold hydrolase, partial [Thermoanaerobaculia bacterium]|nr:alpha/beta fold hydrolase [Thermoanaerobaculia bacterium]
MPWTDRDEIRLFFDDLGSGRPILLLHSFLCSREMWSYQAADLARSYRVVNADLRGHGDSGPAEAPFTLDDLVDDAVVVLDHLGIERAVWAGLSIGGMIALRAALIAPDRVDALIVADSSAERDPLLQRAKHRLL